MGAWGSGIYENDEALDFALELVEGDGLSALEAAIDAVTRVGSSYLEASEAQRALVAADVTACLLGRPGPEKPPELAEFIARSPQKPSEELMRRGREAVGRILQPHSELFELWEDSDDLAPWRSAVEDVASRL